MEIEWHECPICKANYDDEEGDRNKCIEIHEKVRRWKEQKAKESVKNGNNSAKSPKTDYFRKNIENRE